MSQGGGEAGSSDPAPACADIGFPSLKARKCEPSCQHVPYLHVPCSALTDSLTGLHHGPTCMSLAHNAHLQLEAVTHVLDGASNTLCCSGMLKEGQIRS